MKVLQKHENLPDNLSKPSKASFATNKMNDKYNVSQIYKELLVKLKWKQS